MRIDQNHYNRNSVGGKKILAWTVLAFCLAYLTMLYAAYHLYKQNSALSSDKKAFAEYSRGLESTLMKLHTQVATRIISPQTITRAGGFRPAQVVIRPDRRGESTVIEINSSLDSLSDSSTAQTDPGTTSRATANTSAGVVSAKSFAGSPDINTAASPPPAQVASIKNPPVAVSRAPQLYSGREGRLWINRELSNMLITLGTADGLNTGSRIDIYKAGAKIAEAVVTDAMDNMSYVKLPDKSDNDLSDAYYQVRIP